MLNRILFPKLDKMLGVPFWKHESILAYHKAEGLIEFKGEPSSKIWLNSLQEPERAEGQNLDWAWIDEARLVPKLDLSLQVIGRRLRGSGRGLPVGAWLTTTPDSPGTPLFKFLEDPKTRNSDSRVYRMTIFDNPYLPKSYIEEMKAAHAGGLAERFLYGRFAAVAEGAFAFDTTKHVLPAIYKDHIVSWVYGVDFGWTNPACILVIGFDGDGRAYVFDEFYKRMATVDDLATAGRELVKTYGPGKLICDPSEPQTIDALVHSGLNAEGNKVRREDGIRDIGSRLQQSGDLKYRLYIHQRCVNLISELMTYNPEVKANDHAVDALRYGLATQPLGPLDGFVLI